MPKSFTGRRDSDDHIFVDFTPGTWEARAQLVPVTNATNVFTPTTPCLNGNYIGKVTVTGAEGNDRRTYMFPEFQGYNIEARCLVRSYQGQAGLTVRGLAQPNGLFHGFVADNNIVFGANWNKLMGFWKGLNGVTLSNDQATLDSATILRPAITSTHAERTANVATLTGLPTSHGILVGHLIWIRGVGSGYDGDQQTVTAVGANSVSYANTGSNQASTALPGKVYDTIQATEQPHIYAVRVIDTKATLKIWAPSLNTEPAWDNPAHTITYDDTTLKQSNYRHGSVGVLVSHASAGQSIEYDWLEAWRI